MYFSFSHLTMDRLILCSLYNIHYIIYIIHVRLLHILHKNIIYHKLRRKTVKFWKTKTKCQWIFLTNLNSIVVCSMDFNTGRNISLCDLYSMYVRTYVTLCHAKNFVWRERTGQQLIAERYEGLRRGTSMSKRLYQQSLR